MSVITSPASTISEWRVRDHRLIARSPHRRHSSAAQSGDRVTLTSITSIGQILAREEVDVCARHFVGVGGGFESGRDRGHQLRDERFRRLRS